jgi:hypothetical protein
MTAILLRLAQGGGLRLRLNPPYALLLFNRSLP